MCGFVINGVKYPVNQKPERIAAGTAMLPFFGFYTQDPVQYPQCTGSDVVRVVLREVDTLESLSSLQLTAMANTQYEDWWMPQLVMPNRDLHLKWQLYIVNPSTGQQTLATETGAFHCRVIQCTAGTEKCDGGVIWQCIDYRWVKTGYPCGVCTPGSVDCNGPGGTRRECDNLGRWIDTHLPCGPSEDFTLVSFINSKPIAKKGEHTVLTAMVQCSKTATRDVTVEVSVWDVGKTQKLSSTTVPVYITGKTFASADSSWDTALLDPATYTLCAKLVD